VLATLEQLDYRGWVSLEYWPTDPESGSLEWLARECRGP
jgi:hydroxypyruvate isomerase